MRVYISGPIANNPNYVLDFRDAAEMLTEKGYEVVNQAAVAISLPEMTEEEYLEIDLLLLSMCEAIYMMPGWEKSCGANREYGYALAKGMEIIKEGETR